jgi:hypothetical protein
MYFMGTFAFKLALPFIMLNQSMEAKHEIKQVIHDQIMPTATSRLHMRMNLKFTWDNSKDPQSA